MKIVLTALLACLCGNALAAELTSDYDERTSLNTVRSLFSQVGALVGAPSSSGSLSSSRSSSPFLTPVEV